MAAGAEHRLGYQEEPPVPSHRTPWAPLPGPDKKPLNGEQEGTLVSGTAGAGPAEAPRGGLMPPTRADGNWLGDTRAVIGASSEMVPTGLPEDLGARRRGFGRTSSCSRPLLRLPTGCGLHLGTSQASDPGLPSPTGWPSEPKPRAVVHLCLDKMEAAQVQRCHWASLGSRARALAPSTLGHTPQ